VDRLDRLTGRLLDDLAREASGAPPASGPDACPAVDTLQQYAAGGLAPEAQPGLERHLDRCLPCLGQLVELRDCLHGARTPAPASPALRARLATLLGEAARPPLRVRVGDAVRRLLGFRVPAWAVAGLAAASVLATWSATHLGDSARAPSPGMGGAPGLERLDPARAAAPHTVTGTVASIREVTSEGVAAHVMVLRDASGATYVLFTWGAPGVRPGDALEADAILTDASQVAGLPVYQGVATDLRVVR
jgi:hypothetical protein